MNKLARLRAWVSYILTVLPKWFGLYLGINGLIFFNLFIFEEAQQQIIFSSWSVKDTQEWPLLKTSVDLLQDIHKTSRTINNYFGWINPIGYMAYNAYNKAEITQINSIRTMLFAQAPELLAGESITFTFRPAEKERVEDYWRMKNNMITVLATDDFDSRIITGKVAVIDKQVIIDARSAKRDDAVRESGG